MNFSLHFLLNFSESPWETRRLKKEMIDARSKIASLETRVNQLHALRRELEVVFEAEKNSFLQQEQRDRMTVCVLQLFTFFTTKATVPNA